MAPDGRGGTFAAVDLGASSGRVMVARVGPDRLDLHEVHRFANRPVRTAGTLHWDVLALYAGVLDGLRAAGRDAGGLDGVGIDSWAVDYGLLDAGGELLGNPVHYRDARHEAAVPAVHAAVGPDELYRVSGVHRRHRGLVAGVAVVHRIAQQRAVGVEQAVVDRPGVDTDRGQRTLLEGAREALDDGRGDQVPVPPEVAHRVAPGGVRDAVDDLRLEARRPEVDSTDANRGGTTVHRGDDVGHRVLSGGTRPPRRNRRGCGGRWSAPGRRR